jgi:hypothetical protein
MNHLYTFLALDLARERAQEAAEARRATHLTVAERPNAVRRGLASGLALVSRATAGAAERLDGVASDEHDRTLAAAR